MIVIYVAICALIGMISLDLHRFGYTWLSYIGGGLIAAGAVVLAGFIQSTILMG